MLNWNRPSIDFYEALGARPNDEWTVYRLSGEALEALGEGYRSLEPGTNYSVQRDEHGR